MLSTKKIVFMVMAISLLGLFNFSVLTSSTINNNSNNTNINISNEYKVNSLTHTPKNVTDGIHFYEIIVGWHNEPAVSGEFNDIEIYVYLYSSDNTSYTPVLGADNNLSVTLTKGGSTFNFPTPALYPVDEVPGLYLVPFEPTQPGSDYITHINGILGTKPLNNFSLALDEVGTPVLFPSTTNPISSINNQVSSLNNMVIVSFIFTGLVLIVSVVGFYFNFSKLKK